MNKRYLFSSLAGIALFALAYLVGGGADATGNALLLVLCNAFTVSGISLIGVALLVLASNHGAFDTLSYGVKYCGLFIIGSLRKNRAEKYYDYVQKRREKKVSYAFLLYTGGAFLAVAVILTVIYCIITAA